MLSLAPSASMTNKFWSHTHILLIFDAATLSHCIIACSLSSPKSEASTAIWSCHGWHLASVPLRDLYGVKFSKRRRKKQSEEIWVCGCFVSSGFEQMESTFLLDSPSFLMLSLFFNDLCVTLIIQMFKLLGPHNASQLLRSLSRHSLYRESHRHRGQTRCKNTRFAADWTSRDD